ncbi:uncharacterized protein BO66DRAFT_8980 [Aspergillus aculeatinus CBS 121060]|uniref:Uncharacterized protein n=1 Tax=Aspergillus aculeatinus CBS 121060 TaxID=1448322 RepID=A0ACD1HQ19_9EURO|nr:hypothetical protein BO66DRAFT_8980 [Aspergillus aculeatinus CBS 121060]RAH75493.1 hypothetical protein BO66DRAFT_8980 [Aspergillus aculeatinus CBS 121060]
MSPSAPPLKYWQYWQDWLQCPLGWHAIADLPRCSALTGSPMGCNASLRLPSLYLLEVGSRSIWKSAHSLLVDRKAWRVCRGDAQASNSGTSGSTSRQWRNGCGDDVKGDEMRQPLCAKASAKTLHGGSSQSSACRTFQGTALVHRSPMHVDIFHRIVAIANGLNW